MNSATADAHDAPPAGASTRRSHAAIRSELLSQWEAMSAEFGEHIDTSPGSPAFCQASGLAESIEAVEAATELLMHGPIQQG